MITGTLPSEIGNLELRELRAHFNQLEGTIPDALYNNVNMEIIRLDNNMLTGSISNMIGRLDGLLELRLSNNTFSGGLPFTFYGLSKLCKYFPCG